MGTLVQSTRSTGLGSAVPGSVRLDVFQLQMALQQAGYSLRGDGKWHIDTEVALGVLVESFDEEWSVEEAYGDQVIFVLPGGKGELDYAVTLEGWDVVKELVDAKPMRPTAPQYSFDVAALQRYTHVAVTGTYNQETENRLALLLPAGAQGYILGAASGSEELRFDGETTVLFWPTAGDLTAIQRLAEAVAREVEVVEVPPAPSAAGTATPSVPVLPPLTATRVTLVQRSVPATVLLKEETDDPEEFDGIAARRAEGALSFLGYYDLPVGEQWSHVADEAWSAWASSDGVDAGRITVSVDMKTVAPDETFVWGQLLSEAVMVYADPRVARPKDPLASFDVQPGFQLHRSPQILQTALKVLGLRTGFPSGRWDEETRADFARWVQSRHPGLSYAETVTSDPLYGAGGRIEIRPEALAQELVREATDRLLKIRPVDLVAAAAPEAPPEAETPWGWILGGLAVVGAGGAYAYAKSRRR